MKNDSNVLCKWGILNDKLFQPSISFQIWSLKPQGLCLEHDQNGYDSRRFVGIYFNWAVQHLHRFTAREIDILSFIFHLYVSIICSRPKFKTQKLWTWVPLRTSCHRSESYIQHIHGGTTSMLVFNKKNISCANPIPKTPKVLKTLTFVKIPYIYIYRPQNPVAYHHVSPWKIMFFTCGSCELYHFRAMFHFSS